MRVTVNVQQKRPSSSSSSSWIFQPSSSPLVFVLKLGILLLLFTQFARCDDSSDRSSDGGGGSEITWTISKSFSCEDEQQLGCRCERVILRSSSSSELQSTKSHTKITCTCEHETQVANLRGSADKSKRQTDDVTWTVSNCFNVTVHAKVLPSTAEANFKLELVNITSVQLRENAFENFIGSTSTDTSVSFSDCNIEQIPARAFPSNLERIEFSKCNIGTISSNAFKQLYMNQMIFSNTKISNIEPNAFYQDLTYWIAKDSHFKRIQSNSITGGIRYMNWSNSIIEQMESNSLSALIGHSIFEGTSFHNVQTHGLTIKEWTSLSFVNNTFGQVNISAIDLTQRSPDSTQTALLEGNVWHEPSPNFVVTGGTEDVIASVRNNTFMDTCECGKTFSPVVTMESSKQWFVKELLWNSRCPISDRAVECLARNESFLKFDELDLLCEQYACIKEYESVSEIYTPQSLPDRLRILAIFIGTLTGAIVLSLLATMCVYLLRRRGSKGKSKQRSHHAQGADQLNKSSSYGGPQDFTNVVYKMPHHPNHHHHVLPHPPPSSTLRPRSTLFEDVEMEDKGVQTMPSELSTDVLQGLREKLSRPDSFWDAKETIDHLYGLIQVREQQQQQQSSNSPLSSPPDVTMCNIGTSTISSSKGPPTSHPPPPPLATMSKSVSTSPLVPGKGVTAMANPYSIHPPPPPSATTRYAQIRSKPKTATTLCEYRDPSDSAIHIYSELNQSHLRNNCLQQTTSQPQQQPQQSLRLPPHRVPLPILCEYNEPKDVQTHVYAELTNCNNSVQQPIGSNSVRVPIVLGGNNITSADTDRADYSHRPTPIMRTPNTFSTMQRPLPDIPGSATTSSTSVPHPSIRP